MIGKGRYRVSRAVAIWGTLAAWAVLSAGASGTAAAQDAAAEYAQTMADIDTYREYNAHLERLLQSQQADIKSLGEQIASLEPTRDAVEPLIQKMFSNLETFVANDLPFMQEERSKRIDDLRVLVEDEESSLASKFRRLLEAYEIEIEYGRNMEAYPGKLEDGRNAQFVHLGRVSLMYRTTDGEETGYWNRNSQSWVVDPAYARAVEEALRMADETTAPDLVTLPVPAAQESRS